MRHPVLGLLASIVLAITANNAAAQSTWSNPDASGYESGGGNRLQSLIDEMNTQLDRAGKDRLIDPWFLRDLRDVIGRYDWPWGVTILSDRFDGQGPQPDQPWQVTAGDFLIDWRHGLRSVVDNGAGGAAPSSSNTGSSSSGSSNDAAKLLFGALLQGALGGGSNGGASKSATQAPPAAPTFAAVQANVAISNAFAIDMEVSERALSSGAADGFEFGPYQGRDASTGYRLSYIAGLNGNPGDLQLLRLTSRGVATIDRSSRPVAFNGATPTRIVWTRDTTGGMQVRVDGEIVIDTVDRTFRNPFDGFAILNRGGDIALRQISISGVGG